MCSFIISAKSSWQISHRYPLVRFVLRTVNLTASAHSVIYLANLQSCVTHTHPKLCWAFLNTDPYIFCPADRSSQIHFKGFNLSQLVFETNISYQLMSLEENVHVVFLNYCSLCPCPLTRIFEPHLLLCHPLATLSPQHSSCSTEHWPRLTCAPHGCSTSLSQQCSTGHCWLPGDGSVGKAFLNDT